jgi:hypothetical protein
MPGNSHCVDRPVLDDTTIPDLAHIKVGMAISGFLKVVVEGAIEQRELLTDLVLRGREAPRNVISMVEVLSSKGNG